VSRAAKAVAAALAAAALPPVLAVGLGWWNQAAAYEQAILLGAFSYLSEIVEATPVPHHPVVGVVFLAALAGALAVLPRVERRVPTPVRGTVALLEGLVCLGGLLAAVGVLAVGMAVDRPVFWGGLLAWLALGARVGGGEVSPAVRTVGTTTAGALVLLAGITLLEGPGLHSPAFRAGEWWLDGPGRSPAVASGVWLVFAAAVVGATHRLRPRGRRDAPSPSRARVAAAVVGLGVAVLGAAATAPTGRIALVSALSALGIVTTAAAIAHRVRPTFAIAPTVGGVLDPRRAQALLLRIVLWAGLCAGRGMLVHMFTAPGELPTGIERISSRTGIFALGIEPDGGLVYFTDRSRTEVGVIDTVDVGSRSWALHAEGADAVEELGGPVDGTIWVSAGRWNPEPAMGLMPVDLEAGPGEYRAVSGCWIASWIPMPDAAARRVTGGRPGDVLLGCEGDAAGYVFRPSTGRTIARIALPDDVEEGVFRADGESLYGISLWGAPSVSRYAFPSGRTLGEAPVGPFNWSVALDGRDRLWVSRFFEGGVMVFDADTLRLEARVPLSFGVRAMIHDPARDRIWAAAAYSGKIWEVETSPPYGRRAYALCGQARDLEADARGRVVVATDCGIFRIDPSAGGAP